MSILIYLGFIISMAVWLYSIWFIVNDTIKHWGMKAHEIKNKNKRLSNVFDASMFSIMSGVVMVWCLEYIINNTL